MSLEKKDQVSITNSTSTLGQTQVQQKDDYVLDLRYFLRNFGDEENVNKPSIIISGFHLDNEDVEHVWTTTIFMIPGLEGSASSLEPLCRNLHVNACVLQLPFHNPPSDLQDMTDRLYETMKPLLSKTTPFNLLGYSYGTLPLISLAARLEAKGLNGTIFCIDGSPQLIKSLFKNRLSTSDDVDLEDDILKFVIEAVLPKGGSITDLVNKSNKLSNHDDKIEYILKNVSKDAKYSREFIKMLHKASSSRLKIIKDFNDGIIKRIKSPIVLLRPRYDIIPNFSKNYELDQFTEGDVKVHYLNGNHVTILQDRNCATIIEKYLNVQ